MKILEGWVEKCKPVGGRWNSEWEDELSSVEVTVGTSELKGAVSGDRLADEEKVGEDNA